MGKNRLRGLRGVEVQGSSPAHPELAEYINIPSRNHLAFSSHDDDDDEHYTSPITPEEPDNSLSIGDEHLDTIPATESNEVIKSSVKDLIPIPSEYEGIPDNRCDVPFRDNSPPLDVSEDQFQEFSDSNNDCTSIDDDYFSIENIDYIELSPPDYELVSLEKVKDDNLHEKLMNINLLIAKIKSLNENPTPDHVLKSLSLFPIPVEDNDSLLEKSDTSFFYSDNSLPEFDNPTPSTDSVLKYPSSFPNSFLEETDTSDNSLHESEIFCFNMEEKRSGNPTSHFDLSLPDYEAFYCDSELDS
nr:hypothetical protein [Tanacetum cinerariifolium]